MSPDSAATGKGGFEEAMERPFPLARRYRRRVLPILAAFVLSLIVLTALAVRQSIRGVHLEFAARRVAEIAAEIERKAPAEWQATVAGTVDATQLNTMAALLRDAASERSIPRLKVYNTGAVALFSTEAADAGQVERNDALEEAIADGERVVLSQQEPDGAFYNEFYIPFTAGGGPVALVFELYEPAGYLSRVMVRAVIPPILVSVGLLSGLVVVLDYLIRRAQKEIDLRAARVRELSLRLESFMSSSAIGAVHSARSGGDLPISRIEVSILYSDVRRFTEFSEASTPEQVAAFLNRIMTIQIECIARHNGDVDKLIGDAVLARFEGVDKESRALAAALEIQAALEGSDLPRGVGIGLFTGPAILGPIGPEARRDFTVIGDSVNIAARLSDAAARGEIVADVATVDRGGAAERFGPVDEIRVKGRETPIDIRRSAA